MSPSKGFLPFAVAALLFLSGCRWLIGFAAYEECPVRPVLVAITAEPQVNVTDLPTFRSTAGCTIVFEVRHRSYDGVSWDPLSGHEYEVRVEPVEPDGRIETGVLGKDGRVSVATNEGHTAVTITVFPPDDLASIGVPEESAIVLLDPPS